MEKGNDNIFVFIFHLYANTSVWHHMNRTSGNNTNIFINKKKTLPKIGTTAVYYNVADNSGLGVLGLTSLRWIVAPLAKWHMPNLEHLSH